jgi:DNA-binding IclR family transcriptional regulator
MDVSAGDWKRLMSSTIGVTLGPEGGGREYEKDVAAAMPMPVTKTSSVPALDRGLAILEAVAKSRSGLTLSQLTRTLDLPKSSVFCLLLTLERTGYLHRNAVTKRYQCEMKLVRIAGQALEGITLREKARPVLRRLLEQTNLTVHMGIAGENEVTLIEKLDPHTNSSMATWIGKGLDFHCTSLGKCLLAFAPDADVDRILSNHALLRHNENTIASTHRLKAELAKVRSMGFAVDDEEEEIGVRCIGAPVLDIQGRAIAAISISGDIAQIDMTNSSGLCVKVRRAAELLSQEMNSVSRL